MQSIMKKIMETLFKKAQSIALKEFLIVLLKESNNGVVIPELIFELLENEIKKYEV